MVRIKAQRRGARVRRAKRLAGARPTRSVSRLRQAPIAALDLDHTKGREVEPEVISRRHGDYTGCAGKALGLLDLIANLLRVDRVCSLDRVDDNEEAIVHVPTECRDWLLGRV